MKILQYPDGTYEIEFENNSIRIEESPAHYGIAGIYTRQTLVDGHNLTTAIKFTNKRDLDFLRVELNALFGWDASSVKASDFQKLAADYRVASAGNKYSEKVIQSQGIAINALNIQIKSLQRQLDAVNTLATLAEKLIDKLNHLK